jgi:myosin heavy subunit
MADQIIGLKVNVDGKQAQSTVGSIRKELKEANVELIKAQEQFGQFSQEAVTAAKRVAELKDQIGDAAEITALFDPGKKFAAFSAALQGVAGGFAAVQGALGLIGVESEDVQKQLLKVQSALAFSEGLSTLTDIAPKLEGLKASLSQIAVIQKANAAANRLATVTMTAFGVSVNTTSVAFRVLKGAIAATGIGLLVVGVASAIEAFNSFTSATQRAADAQKEFNDSIVKGANVGLKAEQEFIERSTKLRVSEAKARGASAEEIASIESQALVSRRNSYERYYKEIQKIDTNAAIDAETNIKNLNNEIQIQENLATAARLEKKKEAEKKAEDQRKQTSEQIKQQTKDANKQLADLEQQNELNKIADEQQRAIKKLELDKAQFEKEVAALKINEKIKARLIEENAKVVDAQIREVNQKRADDEAKQEAEYQQKVADVKAEVQLNAIVNEDERSIEAIRLKYQKQFDEITAQETESGIKQTELRKALIEQQDQEIAQAEQKIKERKAAENIAELEKIVNDDAVEIERRKEVLDELAKLNEAYFKSGIITYEQYVKVKENLANAEITIEEKKIQKFYATANAYADLLGKVSNLLGKSTAAGKAAAIAEATINTIVASVKAFKANAEIPPSPFVGIAAAAVATAAGIKQIQAIKNVQVPNIGGGSASIGGVNIPSLSATAPIRPTLPLTQTITQLPANTINQMGSANIRAYVVESDITSGQERIRRLNRAARLG